MPRTKIDKTEVAEAREVREQTWRVLLLDEPAGAGEPRWHELESLTGSGEYGYKPDAAELGALHGAGTFMLLEVDPEKSYHSWFGIEVGHEPTYYDVKAREELERWRAEREAEREAGEVEAGV